MKLWLDAHLSPNLAPWIASTFGVEARAIRELGLRDAKDSEISESAYAAQAVLMTKDRDFVDQQRPGRRPQVLWVTCGNTSNTRLKEVPGQTLPQALKLLDSGEPVVEIGDTRAPARRGDS